MRTFLLALLGASLVLVGCTDAQTASWGALGSESKIVCYSGADTVLVAESTGRVSDGGEGQGLGFKDKATGKYVRAFADCIVFEQ